MFEMFDGITSAWGEVRHISELTGLSVGLLLAMAALIYCDPTARKLAIRTAAAVVAAYFLAIFAYHLGFADEKAQRDAADARAALARKNQDASAETKLATDFPPPTKTDDQVSPDEAKILADLAAAAGGSCQLGSGALRLRH
jgi:hypothetical protein